MKKNVEYTLHVLGTYMIISHVAITDRKCEKFQAGDKLWVENGCYNDVKNDHEPAGF